MGAGDSTVWKRATLALFVAWALTLAFLASILIGGNTSPQTDGRTAVHVTAAERDLILAEMRGLLSSINGAHAALATDDKEGAAKAFESSGIAVVKGLAEQERTIIAKLPAPMKALGMATHDHFDALAKATREDEIHDAKQLHAELNTLTARCVACHATYRLVVDESSEKPVAPPQ